MHPHWIRLLPIDTMSHGISEFHGSFYTCCLVGINGNTRLQFINGIHILPLKYQSGESAIMRSEISIKIQARLFANRTHSFTHLLDIEFRLRRDHLYTDDHICARLVIDNVFLVQDETLRYDFFSGESVQVKSAREPVIIIKRVFISEGKGRRYSGVAILLRKSTLNGTHLREKHTEKKVDHCRNSNDRAKYACNTAIFIEVFPSNFGNKQTGCA